jgi:L-ascorbate metabolism protein UlaG (beta-lactamase superfamily)
VILPAFRCAWRARALGLLALAIVLGACTGVGGPKPGAPAHHREHGFANTSPTFTRPPFWTRIRFFASRMAQTTFAPRTATFPVVPNDGAALRANTSAPTVTWVGHATLLVQLDGVNVLTDPQWSERASPLSFAGPKRVTPPALAFEALPPVHVVVISHDHYDHLDVATVRRLADIHKPRFLVPLGMKAWFADLGIADVEELDWWDARTIRGLTFTCVPAQHFAQRTLLDMNRRLWAGWTIAGRERRLFFAGDTAYFDGFKEIGARLGPFDLAAIPIGAYLPPVIMKQVHTDPADALEAFADVRGRALLPIHWGTFDLAEEPLEEPPRLLERLARERGLEPDRLWIFRHGETRGW